MDFNKEAVEAVADANANFGNALLKVFHRAFVRKFKNIDTMESNSNCPYGCL